MKASICILLTLSILGVPAIHAENVRPISVAIVAQAGPDGFVDSARTTDSVKDLIGNMSKRKGIVVVADPKAADITMEVVSSGGVVAGTESSTHVRQGIFGGVNATTTTEAKVLPSMTVMLHVRNSEYSKELSFTGQLFWKDLAKRIGNQAMQWIDANRPQIYQAIAK